MSDVIFYTTDDGSLVPTHPRGNAYLRSIARLEGEEA